MAAKCPLFNNPKVLCRIKPASGHPWTGADQILYRTNYCESNYYLDCEDFAAYLEQQAIVRGKILVVDDEEKLVESLSSFFTARGYETMTATSAEAALELLKGDQPALAIVDMRLPGLNGLEFVKILKRDYPGVKVFVATAFDEEHKAAAEALGIDGFFAKPLALEQLKDAVVRVLAPAERRLQLALEAAQPAEGTAKAKLLFFLEALPNEDTRFAGFLKEQFANKAECEGDYELEFAYTVNEALEKLMAFRPDIVLIHFDSLFKLSCGQLCARIQQSPYRPREVIVFGLNLASFDKREVEELGARYVDQRRSFSKLVRTVKHTALRLAQPSGPAQGSGP